MPLKPLALNHAFYAYQLSPDQQARARELLRKRLDQAERIREGVVATFDRLSSAQPSCAVSN
jgi:hypothetical protein